MHIKVKKHLAYYISLLCIQLLGLILTISLSYDRGMMMIVIILTTLVFNIWALIHHYLDHDLTARIVVEYVLMGSLGMTVAFFTIMR